MKPTEIEKEKERQKVIEESEALIRYKKYLELSKKNGLDTRSKI